MPTPTRLASRLTALLIVGLTAGATFLAPPAVAAPEPGGGIDKQARPITTVDPHVEMCPAAPLDDMRLVDPKPSRFSTGLTTARKTDSDNTTTARKTLADSLQRYTDVANQYNIAQASVVPYATGYHTATVVAQATKVALAKKQNHLREALASPPASSMGLLLATLAGGPGEAKRSAARVTLTEQVLTGAGADVRALENALTEQRQAAAGARLACLRAIARSHDLRQKVALTKAAARTLTAIVFSLQQADRERIAELNKAADLIRNSDGTVQGAADALKAQALATGAAEKRNFTEARSYAAVIAVATGALLRQAAGHGPAPATLPGADPYQAPNGHPTTARAVMGPVPDMQPAGQYRGPRRDSSLALTPFDGDISHTGWPDAGVGMAGAAPLLPANGVTVHPELPEPYGTKEAQVLRAQVAVNAALSRLGSPYVWAAAGPSTFDCSGLTLWAWGHAGVALTHYSGAQAGEGQAVTIEQALPGDLVIYGSPTIHHVGMYLGAGYMINAPATGQYVEITRIDTLNDFLTITRP